MLNVWGPRKKEEKKTPSCCESESLVHAIVVTQSYHFISAFTQPEEDKEKVCVCVRVCFHDTCDSVRFILTANKAFFGNYSHSLHSTDVARNENKEKLQYPV